MIITRAGIIAKPAGVMVRRRPMGHIEFVPVLLRNLARLESSAGPTAPPGATGGSNGPDPASTRRCLERLLVCEPPLLDHLRWLEKVRERLPEPLTEADVDVRAIVETGPDAIDATAVPRLLFSGGLLATIHDRVVEEIASAGDDEALALSRDAAAPGEVWLELMTAVGTQMMEEQGIPAPGSEGS